MSRWIGALRLPPTRVGAVSQYIFNFLEVTRNAETGPSGRPPVNKRF
jgi:hypothetical protein